MEFSESRINAIVEDPDGTIWIATRSQGLFAYKRDCQTVQQYTIKNGLSDNRISSLLVDRSDRLWIGTTGGGLNVLDRTPGRFRHYRHSSTEMKSLLSDEITSFQEDTHGEIWIGTKNGLNVLNPEKGQIRRENLPSPLPHAISSIVQDPSGTMWVAVAELGLVNHAAGTFTLLKAPEEVHSSMSSIKTLYLDPVASTGRTLLFWIGTRYGVNKMVLSKNPFSNHLRNQRSLRLNRGAILSLCEDRNGILWVGLWGGGLNGLYREGGTYRRVFNFEANPSNALALPNGDVGAVLEDRDENLWIGTNGGLARLNPERKHMVIYSHADGDSASLVGNDITRLYEDRSGTLWICTSDGLSQLVQETRSNLAKVSATKMADRQNLRKSQVALHRFKNYLHRVEDSHPIGRNQVSDILEDHQDNIWVATYGRGLNKLRANGTFTRFIHRGDSVGNRENFIYTFVEDREGVFWLSTTVGLVSFNPHSGVFQRHPIDQLHDAHIFGIFPASEAELWLSTSIGLAKFNPKTNTFVRFDEKYGIPFRELFSGFFKNAHGKLFVGDLDGFTEFFPENVSTISRPPEIVITSFKVLDREFSSSVLSERDVRLSYDQNLCSFSFAALDYANPLRNRFAYKMEGVDRDWIDAGTHNYASYTNLDPGSYVFHVKGCNSDNVWNEAGTSISIVITPPYWQTWWFRILIAGLIAGLMYAAYRYRLRRLLEVERLRLRIADDLHDDVGSNLSTIAMVSRAVQRAPGLTTATKRRLAEIYDTAITTSEGMKDIVWFIKPKNDRLDDLLLRMKDTASSLLSGLEYDFHTPKNDPAKRDVRITIDFKRNFFLAFKEILTNIVKHASATKVQIQVQQRDGILETVISDNGRGFDQLTVRCGNGLSNLLNRAQNIGGLCEITSQPGRGTTVRFSGRL